MASRSSSGQAQPNRPSGTPQSGGGRRVSAADLGIPTDARLIAVTGVMTAVIFVLTYYVKVPTGVSGYVHIGDIGVYVAAFVFGPIVGFISAAVGTTLADLAGGYGSWAPGTFVIHGLQGLVAGLIAWRRGYIPMAIAGLVGGAILTIGYFLYLILLISNETETAEEGKSAFGTAVSALPTSLVQALIGMAFAIPIVVGLYQAYPPVRRFASSGSWVEE